MATGSFVGQDNMAEENQPICHCEAPTIPTPLCQHTCDCSGTVGEALQKVEALLEQKEDCPAINCSDPIDISDLSTILHDIHGIIKKVAENISSLLAERDQQVELLDHMLNTFEGEGCEGVREKMDKLQKLIAIARASKEVNVMLLLCIALASSMGLNIVVTLLSCFFGIRRCLANWT